MKTPVVPPGARGYVAVMQQGLQATIEANGSLEEALKSADFEAYRLSALVNVLLGRLGSKERLDARKWPNLFQMITRHEARQKGEYNGIDAT